MKNNRIIHLIWMIMLFFMVISFTYFIPDLFGDVNEIYKYPILESPSGKHLFGTDDFGRDLFLRVLFGMRTSVFIAIAIELLSLLFGVAIGLVVGYMGGVLDEIFLLIINTMMGFPTIILALGVFSIFGQSIIVLIMVITLTHWISYARLVRPMVASLKEADFVRASFGLGASKSYVIFQHILINVIIPIIPLSMVMVGHMIMAISGLAFLGFGVAPPNPEIGIMLKESIVYIQEAPWMVICPGLVLFAVSLYFNMLGEKIRDLLDPKTSVNWSEL